MYACVYEVKDTAKSHRDFLQVHGISPYPLPDRCRMRNVEYPPVGQVENLSRESVKHEAICDKNPGVEIN